MKVLQDADVVIARDVRDWELNPSFFYIKIDEGTMGRSCPERRRQGHLFVRRTAAMDVDLVYLDANRCVRPRLCPPPTPRPVINFPKVSRSSGTPSPSSPHALGARRRAAPLQSVVTVALNLKV